MPADACSRTLEARWKAVIMFTRLRIGGYEVDGYTEVREEERPGSARRAPHLADAASGRRPARRQDRRLGSDRPAVHDGRWEGRPRPRSEGGQARRHRDPDLARARARQREASMNLTDGLALLALSSSNYARRAARSRARRRARASIPVT